MKNVQDTIFKRIIAYAIHWGNFEKNIRMKLYLDKNTNIIKTIIPINKQYMREL